jgi:DNA-binding response OmpR family regulator
MKILIVDDDEQVRTLLQVILSGDDHEVKVAHDGIQALMLYKSYKPDLLITDVLMPNMDGVQLANNVRKLNQEARILFISGGIGDYSTNELKPLLQKPFNVRDLHLKISTVLGEQKTTS